MTAEDDATTQQNTNEEKPDVQTMQIVVRAQVRKIEYGARTRTSLLLKHCS